MAQVNQYWEGGVAEFFGEKGRIFQFLGACSIIFDEKWQKIF
jgi:hypothetical protein